MPLLDHHIKGTPEANGPRLVPVKELMDIQNNPKFNEALRTIDGIYLKEYGQPTQISVIRAKQLVKDIRADRHAKEQARAIDIAKMKHEGKLNISPEQAILEQKIIALNKGKILDPVIQKRRQKRLETFDLGRK